LQEEASLREYQSQGALRGSHPGIVVMKWSLSDIPRQTGKIAVITGASAGMGRETTRILAGKGTEVVMAVRNVTKGNKVADAIRAEQADAKIHVIELDLSKLASVHSFANEYIQRFNHLDLIINNAGFYGDSKSPKTTEDGFAMMMGVNHLGHFALTGLLLDRLLSTPKSRIVTISSGAHRGGKVDLDSFHTIEAAKQGAYGNSKLANMLFTLELQRKLESINAEAISVSAGPGPTKTDGAKTGIQSIKNPVLRRVVNGLADVLMESSEGGAMPTLRAATDPRARGGDYFVPGGFMGMRGCPIAQKPEKVADNEALAKGLWTRSEELTKVVYIPLQQDS
jgi:NAD(P)-dependent dehydrogenase (short-subunit alcohol dehydrogenase family)